MRLQNILDTVSTCQREILVEEAELVALEACEGLPDVAADPGKVRLVAVERQHLLVRHDPRPVPGIKKRIRQNNSVIRISSLLTLCSTCTTFPGLGRPDSG